MRCEIPEVGRCCFCFPLRLGLIVWGYIKIVADLLLLIFLLLFVSITDEDHWTTASIIGMIIYFIILGSLLADIIFHIIFAVGAHKKDPKKMDLFAKFSIYIFVLYVVGLLLSIGFIIYKNNFTVGAIFFCCIICQIYIMVLVRSEVNKLKRNLNFEFVNQVATASDVHVKLAIDGVVA